MNPEARSRTSLRAKPADSGHASRSPKLSEGANSGSGSSLPLRAHELIVLISTTLALRLATVAPSDSRVQCATGPA